MTVIYAGVILAPTFIGTLLCPENDSEIVSNGPYGLTLDISLNNRDSKVGVSY